MGNNRKCRSVNPINCAYHGLELKIAQAVKNNDFELHYELMREKERFDLRGGHSFIESNGKVIHSGLVSPQFRKITKDLSKDVLFGAADYHLNPYARKYIKSEDAEIIISETLKRKNYTVDYIPGSHRPGPDIYLENIASKHEGKDFSISVKSGNIRSNGLVKISGSRTTRHETIEEKLAFLEETSPDMYCCFSVEKTTPEQVHYKLLVFPGDVFSFGSPEDWVEEEKKWVKKSVEGSPVVSATIVKSMSAQVWVNLDTHAENLNISHVSMRVNKFVE